MDKFKRRLVRLARQAGASKAGMLPKTWGSVPISSTFGHKAADGVRVSAVAAGPTGTDFLVERMGLSSEQAEAVKTDERGRIPLGRRGTPDEVAHWIVSLASQSTPE